MLTEEIVHETACYVMDRLNNILHDVMTTEGGLNPTLTVADALMSVARSLGDIASAVSEK